MPKTLRTQKELTSKDASDLYWTLGPLFLQLSEILRPLVQHPDRVRISHFDSVAEQELAKGMHWNDSVMPVVLAVSKETGVKLSEIQSVLLQWWHPVELGGIKQLAETFKKGKDLVQREIRLRRTILNTALKLGYPPLPPRIASDLRANCNLALKILVSEHTCYSQAERLLLESGATILNTRNEKRRKDKTKPRTGKTRTAVLALRRLFAHKMKSDRRQSVLIYQLLSSWNANLAPPTSDSIRTGYK